MDISLQQILALVGNLDDTSGEHTSRERFRQFLRQNATEVGQIRDYIEECLRTSGDQYSRALQDLINYLGRFLGFEIEYGRYQGVQGQIGFDGHWKSLSSGYHIVVEVKTTEVYAIKTATLLNYINELVSQKAIPESDKALGLYIVGRPDPEIRQLENAIIAEKKTHQLRIISADSLLSIAEMMNEYDIAHEDVLALLRPSAPTIDPVIVLMSRLVAGARDESEASLPPPAIGAERALAKSAKSETSETTYWLTPVKSTKVETAEECIEKLVGKEHIYAFGEHTPGRKRIKPGDRIAFYANGKGVIGDAKVASAPENKPNKHVHDSERYPWVFRLSDTKVYTDKPTVIDADMRSKLEAFKNRDPKKSWAWYVQGTGKIEKHDYELLTGRAQQK